MLYNLDKEKKKRVSPKEGEENMEKDIVKIINEDLKWYERVLVRIARRTFIKVSHKIRIEMINHML